MSSLKLASFKFLLVALLLIRAGALECRADTTSRLLLPDDSCPRQNFKSLCQVVCTKAVVSKPAPFFETDALIEQNFNTVNLTQYLGKYVVLLFYPLDFTYVCPTEILAISDRMDEFKALNTEVLAISVDSKYAHLAWSNISRKDGGITNITVPLLADLNRSISKSYGVYSAELGHSLRATFIIDNKGILRYSSVMDLSVGRSINEIKRIIEAFQYSDLSGELCPVNWKPGKSSIIPKPAQILEYFEKMNKKKQ